MKTDTHMRRSFLIAFISLAIAGALLGVSANLAKVAGQAGVEPLAFVTWSIFGAALSLTTYAWMNRYWPNFTKQTMTYFLVSALVSVAVPNLIMYSAVPHVGAGFVALAFTFPPLFTYVGAVALRMESFDIVRLSGVALAMAGALILTLQKQVAPGPSMFWFYAVLSLPIVLAVGNIYRTARWPDNHTPQSLAPGMLAASVLLLLGASLFPGQSLALSVSNPFIIGLMAVQILVFSAQYYLYFLLQKHGGPVLLSFLGSVGAVVGVPIAVFALGEDIPAGLGLAAALIIGGVVLTSRRPATQIINRHTRRSFQ